MTIREGRWDCQYCGQVGILGREKSCPNCARSRPEGTRFYLPDEQAAASEQKLVQQAKIGPDWICQFCSSSNPANATVCHHCNAAREGSSPQQEVKTYRPGEAPKRGDMDLSTPPPARTVKTKAATPVWLPIVGVVGVLLILACLCGGFFLFRSSETEATIESFNWERTVAVEAFRTVTEQDWDVPAGGRTISQEEAIRSYEQVLSHYETRERQVSEQVQVGERTYVCGQRDLGNGFFEDIECTDPVYETRYRTETYQEPVYDQVPIYDTYYTYEIDKWVPDRTERAAGRDQNPFWPEVPLGEGERAGPRTESYQITFLTADGERHTLDFGLEEWLSFEPGGSYKLKISGLGNDVEVVR